jgi:hypothetical protein
MGTNSITVSSSVFDRLQDYAAASGKPPEHLAEAALTRCGYWAGGYGAARSTSVHAANCCTVCSVTNCLFATHCLCRFLDEQEMQAWGCGDEQAAEQQQQPQAQQQQRSISSQRRDFERMQSLVPLYIAGAGQALP